MPCANDTLSSAQKAVMEAIVAFGRMAGFSNADIQIAVQVAFLESSMGQNLTNSASSARGLFHYTTGTWSDRHSGLNRDSFDDQIIAFYSDLVDLRGRYETGIGNGDLPTGMGFGEYVYMRHHDGWYYSNYEQSPGRNHYNANALEFCINSVPTNPSWTDPSYWVDPSGIDFSYWDNYYMNQMLDRFAAKRMPIITVGDPVPDEVPMGALFELPEDEFVVMYEVDLANLNGVERDDTTVSEGRFATLFVSVEQDIASLDGGAWGSLIGEGGLINDGVLGWA